MEYFQIGNKENNIRQRRKRKFGGNQYTKKETNCFSENNNITLNQIKSNQSNLFFYMILQILVYTNKNKMAKYLQWKIMCGETTCKETLYKPRPHNAKKKKKKKKRTKLKQIKK